MARIAFTRNYRDLSTDQGFQFEFVCDRCSSGFRTRFQASTIGTIAGALDAANSLFGGILGRVADLGERARSASWERAHDEAFEKAAGEMKVDFRQCPRCSSWVCKGCWNNDRGLCKNCAPDLQVEMAAAQSDRTVQEIYAHSQVAEQDRARLTEDAWRAGVRADCPSCGAALSGPAKFCPECGTTLAKKQFCSECGSELKPGAKFCMECGTKQG